MTVLSTIKQSIVRYKLISTKAKIINVWEKDTQNIGDLTCAPSLYFKELNKNSLNVGISLFTKKNHLKDKVIIIGGGGLLLSYFATSINNLLSLAHNNKVILWGIGFDNYIDENELIKINDNHVTRIGIRDFGHPKYDYVPCVSCMSSLFDQYKNQTIKADYGLFLHNDYSSYLNQELTNLPRMYNKSVKSFKEAICFLSSHNTILTNSFHGLYWSTLLGKNVIVLPWVDKNGNSGFSNKFRSFKYKPYFCNEPSKYLEISELENYKHALDECRNINKNFLLSIKSHLQ